MNDSKFLVFKNLCVWYTPDKPILSDFSIELGANEVVGLIGLDGAGKTTFKRDRYTEKTRRMFLT